MFAVFSGRFNDLLEETAQHLRTNASGLCSDSRFANTSSCRVLREFAAAVYVDSGKAHGVEVFSRQGRVSFIRLLCQVGLLQTSSAQFLKRKLRRAARRTPGRLVGVRVMR